MNNKNYISGILTGTLIGGLAGAVTMFLLAPQSGEKTRAKIQQKGIELRDQATELVEDSIARVRKDSKNIAKSSSRKARELLHQSQELALDQFENASSATKSWKKANLSS